MFGPLAAPPGCVSMLDDRIGKTSAREPAIRELPRLPSRGFAQRRAVARVLVRVFCSLDRVDLVTEEQGVRVCIQTDHRSIDEMEENPEISVLFALIRTLLPRRFARGDESAPRVRYAALAGVSSAVRDAVAAAGAELESSESGAPQLVPYPGEPPSPSELADRAFTALAHRVALREGVPISVQGLETFQARIQETSWDFDDRESELQAWTAALELAALTGECIRHLRGGRWVWIDEAMDWTDRDLSPSDFGLLPFALQAEGPQAMLHNVANKAVRAMSEPGQSVLQMLVALREREEDGVTMVTLKPADWAVGRVVRRPLLPGTSGTPTVVICNDHPDTVSYAVENDHTPEQVAGRFEEALANLARVRVQVDQLELERDMDLYVVHGDFYAAEKILDEAFMHGLHAKLGQELLAVSIPVKGRMFVTAGAQHPDNLAALVALTRGVYENEANPISDRVFGVIEGKVSALVSLESSPERSSSVEPPKTKKKGFWRRLFN